MYHVRNITEDLFYVGGSDRRISQFENLFPIPRGVSYNSYLLRDEQTVLFDTVDHAVSRVFLENVEHVLDGRSLDYLIINHMEPDHNAVIAEILLRYPEVTLVGNAKTFTFMDQFFGAGLQAKRQVVREGDVLTAGSHTLRFVMMPMVHWPEAMATFDEKDRILFSADAFGSFGALGGNIFDDELAIERDWLPDARRYYANIVGKYGPQVQAVLKKAAALPVRTICPLHGPIWRSKMDLILEKYQLWSTGQPEERGVLIAYASMYGDTAEAADYLAMALADRGVREIEVRDISRTHVSELIAGIFCKSHIVLAAPTYNNGLYPLMENLLHDMEALGVQNRCAAVIENGTWAPQSGRKMTEHLAALKNVTVLQPVITLRSACSECQKQDLDALADTLAEQLG